MPTSKNIWPRTRKRVRSGVNVRRRSGFLELMVRSQFRSYVRIDTNAYSDDRNRTKIREDN